LRQKLINSINLFYKINFRKKATLEQDMAKRIMLSVLPAVSNQSELMAMKGFPDIKALRYAVSGVDKLIESGVNVCVDELHHYKRESADVPVKHLISQGQIKQALETAISIFSDSAGWEGLYGGPAWTNIAKTLLKLQISNENLKQIKLEQKKPNPDPSLLEREFNIMTDIVTNMNVFDGMVHNTGNVLDKMIQLEYNYNENESNSEELDQRRMITEKMMDSKELQNSIDVYNVIKPTIESIPGSNVMYKDWLTKIRNHPDYNKDKSKIEEELKIISKRKHVIKMYKDFLATFEMLEDLKNKIIKTDKVQYKELSAWRSLVDSFHAFVTYLKYVKLRKEESFRENPELISMLNEIKKYTTELHYSEDFDVTTLNSMFHNMKKLLPKIENIVASI